MKPWVNRGRNNYELRRSGTTAQAFVFPREVPPLKGLNKYILIINPGLAPWAMKSVALKGYSTTKVE